LYYISLVAEDTNVLKSWIFLSESKYFSFIRGDSNRSSVAGDRDKHVFVAETIKSLSKGVFCEEICFIAGLSSVELIPVVIHIYNSNIKDIKPTMLKYQITSFKQLYIFVDKELTYYKYNLEI